MVFAPRSCAELLQRQEQGTLRVCSALEFRSRAEAVGLEQAYADTDVVAAGSCGFTDQGQLWLSLGPSDPPLRLRQARLGGVGTSGGFGAGELCLPIGGNASDARRLGGAQVLDALLAGAEVPLELQGEATTLHPRRELLTTIQLERLNQARLLLARGISENGIVAVSSSEGLLASPFGGLLGPFGNALFNASGARSIGGCGNAP